MRKVTIIPNWGLWHNAGDCGANKIKSTLFHEQRCSCDNRSLDLYFPLLQERVCLCAPVRCGRSAVYRTREMAARALVPFVLLTQVPSTVHTLLQELPAGPGPSLQHNHVHGTLLQVWTLTHPPPATTTRTYTHTHGGGKGGGVTTRWISNLPSRCGMKTFTSELEEFSLSKTQS